MQETYFLLHQLKVMTSLMVDVNISVWCCSVRRACQVVISVCSRHAQGPTLAGIQRASHVASVRSCSWISSTSIGRVNYTVAGTMPRR